jgi:hypothetical protein
MKLPLPSGMTKASGKFSRSTGSISGSLLGRSGGARQDQRNQSQNAARHSSPSVHQGTRRTSSPLNDRPTVIKARNTL